MNKIAEDYEQTRKKGAKEQAAYEELLIAVREIRMGVSEGAAYEKFGKRTGVREYIRLSTFLTQNVKKGKHHAFTAIARRGKRGRRNENA